jgi:hypothetical protein
MAPGRVPRGAALLEFSPHLLILLGGFAIALLSLFGVFAVGPYGRRGVRFMLGLVALAAFAGSVGYLVLYLGMIDQRRALETRIAELRAQAMTAGPLACLERTDDAVQAACAQSLFASPGSISAARVYTTARLDLLTAAHRYSGPRTPQFEELVAALQHSLQEDPFGLTADSLMRRESCTEQRCPSLALFADTARLSANIRDKTFDANVARYTAAWTAPPPAAPPAAPSASASAPVPKISPSGETRAPIPDKYELPSSASIPPVSIMTDEPPQRAAPPPAAKDRPAAPPQEAAAPAAATPPVQAETPPRPRPQKQAPRKKDNAPLSIAPQ